MAPGLAWIYSCSVARSHAGTALGSRLAYVRVSAASKGFTAAVSDITSRLDGQHHVGLM